MDKSVYIEVSDGQSELFWHARFAHFFSVKKGFNQIYQNNSFHHKKYFILTDQRDHVVFENKKTYEWVFFKAVFALYLPWLIMYLCKLK